MHTYFSTQNKDTCPNRSQQSGSRITTYTPHSTSPSRGQLGTLRKQTVTAPSRPIQSSHCSHLKPSAHQALEQTPFAPSWALSRTYTTGSSLLRAEGIWCVSMPQHHSTFIASGPCEPAFFTFFGVSDHIYSHAWQSKSGQRLCYGGVIRNVTFCGVSAILWYTHPWCVDEQSFLICFSHHCFGSESSMVIWKIHISGQNRIYVLTRAHMRKESKSLDTDRLLWGVTSRRELEEKGQEPSVLRCISGLIFCNISFFLIEGKNGVHLLSSEGTFVLSAISLESFRSVNIKKYFQSHIIQARHAMVLVWKNDGFLHVRQAFALWPGSLYEGRRTILQNTLTSERGHNTVLKVDPVHSFLYCFNTCFLTEYQPFAFLLKFAKSYIPNL